MSGKVKMDGAFINGMRFTRGTIFLVTNDERIAQNWPPIECKLGEDNVLRPVGHSIIRIVRGPDTPPTDASLLSWLETNAHIEDCGFEGSRGTYAHDDGYVSRALRDAITREIRRAPR